MNDWKGWSERLAQVGPQNFYSQNYFSDYFPGYLYVLWFGGYLFNLLQLSIGSLYFDLFAKAITTLFDFGSAYYIFKIIKSVNKSRAHLASVSYLLNPAVIFNTSVWGQVDGIFTFFLIASFYYLIQKKDLFKSSPLFLLGVLVKPQSLPLLPLLLFIGLKNFPRVKFLKSLALGIAIFILLSLPFFPKNPILGIFNLAASSQDVYKYTSLFAFNFWSLIGWWKDDGTIFILSYKIWGMILFLISTLLIFIPIFRKKIDLSQYFFASSLSLFSFFLLLTRIHERYLFPFLAFILITAMLRKSKFLFLVYILSSIIHFINLWFVYYYYNFVYNNPSLANNLFYSFINNNYKIFSIVLLILFVSLFIFYYKHNVKKS